MPVHIPEILTPDQVAECRRLVATGSWVDGRSTAGPQAAHSKKNMQLAPECTKAAAARAVLLQALSDSLLFRGLALPRLIYPPMFNRYDEGMTYGLHVDNSVQTIPGANGQMMRADLSATLFLSDLEEYEDGELDLVTDCGSELIRLPAGDMIVYPTTMLHRVTPVTRGNRVASFFWIQSLVRDAASRSLLFALDRSIIDLRSRTQPDDPAVLSLTNVYHNLVRQWCDA
ncbi:Fe2+-dependent dioxygenase [Acetobacter sp. DsW_063]|uniref:Fe2+-dependent dioxygenase n=1 Tax=Acetobacter sp. DsW_063 TaxID=1514894 RepID=UPI000A3B9320|nr:Fe2+-dependent dioxygenase [Acetobacter sp. DsW_063]OUJ16835.1 Fe(II)-dependent oxygenase [Acetobacter sp. DsW_063]